MIALTRTHDQQIVKSVEASIKENASILSATLVAVEGCVIRRSLLASIHHTPFDFAQDALPLHELNQPLLMR